MVKIKEGIIKSIKISKEHCHRTIMIMIYDGMCHQGFGGYNLDEEKEFKKWLGRLNSIGVDVLHPAGHKILIKRKFGFGGEKIIDIGTPIASANENWLLRGIK